VTEDRGAPTGAPLAIRSNFLSVRCTVLRVHWQLSGVFMDNMNVIERYRKTACKLRSRGKNVTKASLARAMRLSPLRVMRTVNRKAWRTGYIGIESPRDVTIKRYRVAATSIGRRVITKSELARALGITLRAVQQFLRRNPETFLNQPVRVVDHHRYAHAVERYRAAAARVRQSNQPMTRKMLAFELGVGRAAVGNILSKFPELIDELGVIDTRDL